MGTMHHNHDNLTLEEMRQLQLAKYSAREFYGTRIVSANALGILLTRRWMRCRGCVQLRVLGDHDYERRRGQPRLLLILRAGN